MQLRDSRALTGDWSALADAETALSATYQQRRRRAYCAFEARCHSTVGVECERLACSSSLLAYAPRGFGLWLYASGAPRHLLTDAINFIGTRWPEWRTLFGLVWKVAAHGLRLNRDAHSRVVIPASPLRAMFGVSLLWGWSRFAGLLLLGFCGMLRPDEFLPASSRRDFILPSGCLELSGNAFLRIAEAKTRRFMRRQHARTSDSEVVRFLEVAFGPLGRDEPLAPYGASSFRSRWNAVLYRLGVPSHVVASGPTPGSLRGTSATEFYLQTEDVRRIAWRGRWRKVETFEHDLQEVATQLLLTDLLPAARAAIGEFAAASSRLLDLFLQLGSASL